METPAEIQFQGMRGTPQIEEMIAAHIAELDERFGRITARRVVVKARSAHHREGDLYEVHIRLAAKALELTVPDKLLATADEVIE